LLSNIFLHEVDRRWCRATVSPPVLCGLVRYADDMVLLARTVTTGQDSVGPLQREFAELRSGGEPGEEPADGAVRRVCVLGFEFSESCWPDAVDVAAYQSVLQYPAAAVREVVRSLPSNEPVTAVIRKLNPVLNGWCTYFRVGQQQTGRFTSGLGGAKRSAVMASTQASV